MLGVVVWGKTQWRQGIVTLPGRGSEEKVALELRQGDQGRWEEVSLQTEKGGRKH